MTISLLRHPRRRTVLVGAAALAASVALPAWAAGPYPNRPIRIVVPYAPGGTTDVVARMVADKLAAALGQPVIIDNKPGANGFIGAEQVARAAPDGYTLLLPAGSVLGLSPLLYRANFDPVGSFAPINMIATWAILLMANPNLPATTLREFIDLARSGKRDTAFAAGTSGYSLLCEQLKLSIGAPRLINVPYNGSGPQVQAVLGGQADIMIDTFSSLQMIRAGKLRALGIFTDKRSPTLPDLPTMKEQGVNIAVPKGYAALFAPAGTAPAIVQRLQDEVAKIVASPDVRERLALMEFEPAGGGSKELASVVAEDIALYRKMIKDTNFKVG